MSGKYDDMVYLPHHVSAAHPRMSMRDRAAQFSPFAALPGYDTAVKETARLTDRQIELDEAAKAELDRKLRFLPERLPEQPEVTVTYFKPDGRKEGGAYLTVTGRIKKFDEYTRVLTLTGGEKIAVEDILELESEAFRPLPRVSSGRDF